MFTQPSSALCFAAPTFTTQRFTGGQQATCHSSFTRNSVVGLHNRRPLWRISRRVNAEIRSCDAAAGSGAVKRGKHEHEHGLTIRRDMLESHTRRNRSLKLRRWITLSELEVLDDLQAEAQQDDVRVDVWIVGQRIGQTDYKIVGKTKATVMRICDRSGDPFEAVSDGRFELMIVGGVDDDGSSDVAEETRKKLELYDSSEEVVELLDKGADNIDLTEHVRDSVLLGLPSRALSPDAVNTPVTYEDPSEPEGWKGEFEGSDALLKLRQQLAEQE